jgi:hypothetical protein
LIGAFEARDVSASRRATMYAAARNGWPPIAAATGIIAENDRNDSCDELGRRRQN